MSVKLSRRKSTVDCCVLLPVLEAGDFSIEWFSQISKEEGARLKVACKLGRTSVKNTFTSFSTKF